MPRETAPRKPGWRRWTALPAAALVCVSTAMAARIVHRFVRSDGRFALAGPRFPGDRGAGISIEGVTYASRERIMRVFAPDFERSVFLCPLAERRRRLLAVDWVEDASVSRVLPNRILVRVREREPVAFVRVKLPGTSVSRIWLIDGQGVLLEAPPKAKFAFPVVSGIAPEQNEADRRMRVQQMLRFKSELGEHYKEISEINLAAPENLVVVANAGGRAVELAMGDSGFRQRYQNFVNSYPEMRRKLGNVSAFDLRLDDRITVKDR